MRPQRPSIPPPAGAPQRVSGKVSGTVTVGTTPVVLDNIDLHAYIVVGDGRAYTAISEVSAPALLPSVNHFTVRCGAEAGWIFISIKAFKSHFSYYF